MSRDFLVEIGTEELPPTSLKALSDAFFAGIEGGLKGLGLQYDSATPYATPRRLAVLVKGLAENTPLKEEKVWGAPAQVAFKDGKPGKAAEAFAKKYGITVEEIQIENDGKQDKLVHMNKTGGDESQGLLTQIVSDSLAKLPIAKRMRWGSSRNEFVRPVKWVIMLFGDQVISDPILGVVPSNSTRGHRFHCNETLTLSTPAEYPELLKEKAHVMASFEERRALIEEQVNSIAKENGGNAVIDEDLLDEVTGLVEWPTALCGKFEEAFLQVPAEALISSMKEHQKYFHLVDNNDALLPNFITVSNIVSKDPAQVVDGNERVIRPRLSDAAFFFETDKKSTLESRREKLKTVVFQAKLGTIYDKTERIAALAKFIAGELNADESKVERAAQLCKSDLVTNMVYEFTDLQGIAGYHYALNDGEDQEVALAMNEQYMPRFAGDTLATTVTGAVIALADRLDTITGIFGIGQKPTGSKDPFALRRASLGALRILVEKGYELDLKKLVEFAKGNFAELPNESVVEDVLNYMLERFKSWYEEENIPAEVFQSVSAKQLTVPLDINSRIHAVAKFYTLSEAEALAAANKRVSNILAKQDSEPKETVDASLLQDEAEKQLAEQVSALKETVEPLIASKEYTEALTQLAQLRATVDKFFDDVMVMTDDEALRNNRLALLNQLRQLFLNVADISYLAVKN